MSSLYERFTGDVVSVSECPIALESFDEHKPSTYITLRRSINLTNEDKIKALREKFGEHAIHPTETLECFIDVYDLECAYNYYVGHNGKDVFTREYLSSNVIRRIQFKSEFRKYYDVEMSDEKITEIFDKVTRNEHVSMEEFYTMKVKLEPHHVRQFRNITREETSEYVKNIGDWVVRPSSVKGYQYRFNAKTNEWTRASEYSALTGITHDGKTIHVLIEHSFGEGYYRCGGSYNSDGYFNIERTHWYPTLFDCLRYVVGF